MNGSLADIEITISDKIMDYVTNLDWSYIVTLIILSYFIVKDQIVTTGPLTKVPFIQRIRPFLVSIPEAWRVFMFGIIYGIFIYWVRGYTAHQGVETIINSLIFSMIFHKLCLTKIRSMVDNKLFPSK